MSFIHRAHLIPVQKWPLLSLSSWFKCKMFIKFAKFNIATMPKQEIKRFHFLNVVFPPWSNQGSKQSQFYKTYWRILYRLLLFVLKLEKLDWKRVSSFPALLGAKKILVLIFWSDCIIEYSEKKSSIFIRLFYEINYNILQYIKLHFVKKFKLLV